MFQLDTEEKSEVVAKCDHLAKLKFSKSMPYVFTEHGVLMAASVLNTQQAVDVSVLIVRAFVKLRRTIAAHKELARKLSQIECRLSTHDSQIMSLVQAIRQLTSPSSVPERRRIGFHNQEP